jgi:histidinol-phosphate phosphatase family protein
MSRQAIILAGGMGTRLRARLGDLPKPMIPFAGKPLLEHQIELCRKHGFTDILIFACYRADIIEAHFGDGAKLGVRIRMVVEREPLGTAGAVLDGFDLLAERFAVLYGDTMVNLDLGRLWQHHEARQADATLVLHPNDHPLDSDLVEVDDTDRITAFHNRPHPSGVWRQNLVNAGLYVMEKRALTAFRHPASGIRHPGSATDAGSPMPDSGHSGILDFGKDLFPAMLRAGKRLLGYNTPEFIKDIGTPERYDKIAAQLASGVVAHSSLDVKQPAVFLDRDGTLVEEVSRHGLTSADQLKLIPHAAEAVHRLNQLGYRTVLVTNQPVIAKGMATEADVREAHNKLETLLGLEHAFLDRIYLCPHHPDKGFPGERPELKIACDCRKPGIGMINRAVADLNIDLAQSWFIGDTTVDLQTAKNAGIRSILVKTGHAGDDGRFDAAPEFVAENVLGAVELIAAAGN